MISTLEDLAVRSEAEFLALPEDGYWEVVEGKAVLRPLPDVEHQDLVGGICADLRAQARRLARVYVSMGVGVLTPPSPDRMPAFEARVPDLVVYSVKPAKCFPIGQPPEVAIEVLSTRRGNVERTEKLADYARAGIREYWIVDPFAKSVELYLLQGNDYVLAETSPVVRCSSFPGLVLDTTMIL